MEISSEVAKIVNGETKKKNIILDVDETLVHTIEDTNFRLLKNSNIMSDPKLIRYRDRLMIFRLEDIVGKKGEGLDTDMWSITRPHLEEFIAFCLSYFENVIIWSAGLDGYVREIVNRLFDPLKGMEPPALIYTRKDCKRIKGTTTKPIEDLIKENPDLADTVNLTNTFFIDDLSSNFIANPENGILIPEYNPNPNITSIVRDDIALKQLIYWFLSKEVKESTDVRLLNKNNIFSRSLNDLANDIDS